MNIRKNQSGFSAVEVLLAIVVVGLLGFGLYTAYNNRQQAQTTTNSTVPTAQESRTANVSPAPEINSTDDLNSAENTLDATDVDNSADNAQLDAQLSSF